MWGIVGQERVVLHLEKALKEDRLAHAYLLVGPPGVGKGTVALRLAQALHCRGANSPCQQCSPCLRIASGNHPDIHLLGLATSGPEARAEREISIQRVRELQRMAALRPMEGPWRVFIVDGAEFLSPEAANALLKVLEEPPAGVLFLLLTVREEALPATLRSRCQRWEIRPVPRSVLEQALEEQWALPPAQAERLARVAQGRPGWAVAMAQGTDLLEQRAVRLAELRDLLGAPQAERWRWAARLALQFQQDLEAAREILCLWVLWWRDLLLLKSGCPELLASGEEESMLRPWAQGLTLQEILDSLNGLGSALRALEANANPRLVLDVLLLALPTLDGIFRGGRKGISFPLVQSYA